MHRKNLCLSMGLVCDPRELLGVMTVRSEVARVLQLVSEPTLMVSHARIG
jgi:hypothetical protein